MKYKLGFISCTMAFLLNANEPALIGMKKGFFLGLGGSFNSVKLDQNLEVQGISTLAEPGGDIVARGQAGGPANPIHTIQTMFAPMMQFGYYDHVADTSNWSWGIKFGYKYFGANFVANNIEDIQGGLLRVTDLAPADSYFIGHCIIGSSQIAFSSQLSLTPFIGYSLTDNSTIYIGGSPNLFSIRSNFDQVTGFAYVNGNHYDETGAPVYFKNSKWMWGGAGEIGIIYNINEDWFCNCSYNYALSARYAISDSAPFTSQTQGYVNSGTVYIQSTQRLVVQSVAISINMIF